MWVQKTLFHISPHSHTGQNTGTQGTKAYDVFVDFAKAFDSPPRGAILKCLDWSGCPPDLSAVIMAIHGDLWGRLCGNTAFFRVT
jgi:hypothetical protein